MHFFHSGGGWARTVAAGLCCASLAVAAPPPKAPPVSTPAAPSAESAPLTEAQKRDIDAIVREVLQAQQIPSASIAIVKDGHLAYAEAYGSARVAPPVPATPQARYAIGSISKQFTAAAILLLAQDGKLSLDDKVGRYFPSLARANEITLREVLSHTSGYRDYWPQDYVPPFMLGPISPDAILQRWAGSAVDFEPGTGWEYSNTNYVLAARIVEKVSGVPFWSFLEQRILKPLGISSAWDFDARPLAGRDAQGCIRFGLGPQRVGEKEGAGWLFGAAELAMTATDLARWDLSLMDRTLLAPKSYELLEAEVPLKSGKATHYALGIELGTVQGHRALEHDGEVSGGTSYNLVLPDNRMAVVVLGNEIASEPSVTDIAERIAGLLLAKPSDPALLAEARQIFLDLQHGKMERTRFSDNANHYFSAQALHDFQRSLGKLGPPGTFVETRSRARGGMTFHQYRASFPGKTLQVIAYVLPDGKFEQYEIVTE